MYSIENRCYRTGKYTVCRCVHASFSSEILHAGAVKGLMDVLGSFVDNALAWALAWQPELTLTFSQKQFPYQFNIFLTVEKRTITLLSFIFNFVVMAKAVFKSLSLSLSLSFSLSLNLKKLIYGLVFLLLKSDQKDPSTGNYYYIRFVKLFYLFDEIYLHQIYKAVLVVFMKDI